MIKLYNCSKTSIVFKLIFKYFKHNSTNIIRFTYENLYEPSKLTPSFSYLIMGIGVVPGAAGCWGAATATAIIAMKK